MAKANRSKSVIASDISEVTGILHALHELSMEYSDSPNVRAMGTFLTCVDQLTVRGVEMLNDCIRKLDPTCIAYSFKERSK